MWPLAVSSFAGSVPPQTKGPKLVGLPQRLSATTAPYSGEMSKLALRQSAEWNWKPTPSPPTGSLPGAEAEHPPQITGNGPRPEVESTEFGATSIVPK